MRFISFIVLLLALFPTLANAQARGRVGTDGRVTLPYTVTDNSGTQWMIYQQGWFRHGGNTPLYGQAGMISINGNNGTSGQNQARLDEKTGELVFEGQNASGINITRRILVNKEESYIRYIDILKNPGAQEMNFTVRIQSTYNFGVQGTMMVYDPRQKDRAIGQATMLESGRAVFEMFAGKGAKNAPNVNATPNSNMLQVQMPMSLGPGKQVAIFHLHGISASVESGQQFITTARESRLLSDLPLDLRKSIVNMTALQTVVDREILRGDLLDVIELRDGDQLKGTIAEKSYRLQTFYGPVELAAERVVAMINIGQFKPRQLVVTADGEVFGGTLDVPAITLRLSSGQTTHVPLAQIERVGYRKRSDEREEWTFDRPMVALRSGERLLIALPTAPIEMMTRFGLMKLPPQSVANLAFQSDENRVHEVRLTDGSKFAGLFTADNYEFQLVGTTAQQKVTIPAAMLLKMWFTAADDEPAADSPTLVLTSQDTLAASLSGTLQLDTKFDTITINAGELRSLTRVPDAGYDVQAALWDQTTMGGQLRDPVLTCKLASGIELKVPLALLSSYTNPQPRPSDSAVERIRTVVKDLAAEDWKARERAEAQLVEMGAHIVPVLKELRSSQPPEAQQRIDSILSQLERKPPRAMDQQ